MHFETWTSLACAVKLLKNSETAKVKVLVDCGAQKGKMSFQGAAALRHFSLIALLSGVRTRVGKQG